MMLITPATISRMAANRARPRPLSPISSPFGLLSIRGRRGIPAVRVEAAGAVLWNGPAHHAAAARGRPDRQLATDGAQAVAHVRKPGALAGSLQVEARAVIAHLEPEAVAIAERDRDRAHAG